MLRNPGRESFSNKGDGTMSPKTTAFVVVLGAVACASSARAQEAGYLQQRVRAPESAIELKVGTAYTQGFGMIAPGRGMPDVARAGLGVNLDIDHRVTRA